MNKRTFLILAIVVALALPTAAMAAAEFSLGGFIKLDAFWDSTQEGKNMNTAIARNNDLNAQHGRLKFTSQGSRFNFTIKGPKLWGATTTGFIEMDFDSFEEGAVSSYGGVSPFTAISTTAQRGGGTTTSGSYTPRLRHAMFRLNWPETELLFGQYWTFASQWFPELAQDGPFMLTGTPTARMAQIRLTQKFLGSWSVGVMAGEANLISQGQTYSFVDHAGGESTEAPQVQAQVEFAQDLYGKAAWYGKPTPFTAQITAGWQRGIIRADSYSTLRITGENTWGTTGGAGITRHQYLDPWFVSGTLFIPVIPTASANLAGTASLQTSWWIGQGVEAFGWTSFGSQVFRFNGVGVNPDGSTSNVYDVTLMSRFGGQVQGQYYFSNQWFLTGAWGMSKAFGVGAFETDPAAAAAGISGGKANAFAADVANYHNEFDLCLWYRPIQAFKFGLQYAYARTNYFQRIPGATGGTNISQIGEAHRVEFVGLFFF